SIVFFVFAKESGFSFLEHAYDFKVDPTHAHLRSRDLLVLAGKESVGGVDTDDHYIGALLIVVFSNEPTFPNHNVGDAGVVGRNTLSVSPTIVVTLVRNVVVKRAAAVADVRGHVAYFLNGACL